MSKKVMLKMPDKKYLSDLYYWKFEDEIQESANWNGPYYTRPTKELTKEEFINKKIEVKYIYQKIPESMYIVTGDTFLGTVNAYWVSEETNWMEIGIVIFNPEYWSGGYGTLAFKQWVDYIFHNSDLHRIGISTWSGNIRMMKLAEKVGMKQEACIRDARIVDGKYYDGIKMGILRSEWEKKMKIDIIETERLLMKKPTLDDVQELFDIHSDPSTQIYNPKGPDTDILAFTEDIKSWIEHHDKHGFGYYTLIDKSDGKIFGVCGLKFKKIENETYLNIYYRISTDKTRNGFVKEAAEAIIRQVNQLTQRQYKLVAQTKYNNIPSIKTAESLGFMMDSSFDDVLEQGNVFLFR